MSVLDIQRRLKALGFSIGTAGPNKDGVDGDVVIVRLTRRELRQVREAAEFFARAGYAVGFLEKLGKWLAAVGAVVVAVKMLFPHFWSGGSKP